jgi:hypothetical protein
VTPQISEVFKNRLNSKENSAISASKKSEIREHLVEIVQYSRNVDVFCVSFQIARGMRISVAHGSCKLQQLNICVSP